MVKAGLGKSEITCVVPGIGMMGYGRPENIVKTIMTPLFSRCLIIQHEKSKPFIFVNIEQCFVSIKITRTVLENLNRLYPEYIINAENLMITAQHTHAAPGGYSEYSFYNFSIPGFSTNVFNTIVDGIIDSIINAFKDLNFAELYYGEHTIGNDQEIGFNRSIKAYNANESIIKRTENDSNLAINRKMQALHIYGLDKRLKGMVNWFGVHCTSISSQNTSIHHDNKGVAAALFEQKNSGTIAIFAQSCAGDVSPNWIWDKKLKRARGKYTDQYENANYNGQLQFTEASKVSKDIIRITEMSYFHSYFDMSEMAAAPAHGAEFFQGTKEGPAVHPFLIKLLRLCSNVSQSFSMITKGEEHKDFFKSHSPKKIIVDHRNGKVLGIPMKITKHAGVIPDPIIKNFIKQVKAGALNSLPWVPSTIPVQLVLMGPIAFAGIPGEITTIAGRQLTSFLINHLNPTGIKQVIICSYANGYMGYITTPEEYDLQLYEGAHTVYGRDTLEGVLMSFEILINNRNLFRQADSIVVCEHELAKRTI